jgi:ABC-type bacteriocin/lantibiotic exporter with double-glycine peptidase domain
MKNLKELKPLIDLLKKDKWKLFFWGIVLLICESCSVLTGYLNGAAVESITKLDLKRALIFLGFYFAYELIIDGIIFIKASNSLVKIESKLTRSIGYEAYRKALNMPAYAYEEMASGEIINRITNDADVLSFTFRRLVYALGDLVACFVLIFYIFYNSWIVGLEILVLLGFLLLLM